MKGILSEAEVAVLLRLSKRTLERFRAAGRGPAYMRLGKRVAYRKRDLEAWLDATRTPRASQGPGSAA
jgi:excisionase family DNA binding protein